MYCDSPKCALVNFISSEEQSQLRYAREVEVEDDQDVAPHSRKIVVEFDSSLLIPNFGESRSTLLDCDDDLELMMASSVLTDLTETMDTAELDDQIFAWVEPQSLPPELTLCRHISIQTPTENSTFMVYSSLHSTVSSESSTNSLR
jgi:hypothetical protein